MKRWILTAVAAGVVGYGVPSARAGDCEWATVGKVLTGVAAGVIIAKTVDCPPTHASVSYGYSAPGYAVSYTVGAPRPCPPPPHVVYAPAPVVIQQPVIYLPAPVRVRPPVFCVPSPVYTVTYSHAGRGHGYGHYKRDGHGKR